MIRHQLILLTIALSTTLALGQDNRVARLAAPFVDDDVLVLIHVDLSKLDVAGFEKAVADVAAGANVPEPMRKEFAAAIRMAAAPIGNDVPAFLKAGGRHVFLLVNPADVSMSPPPLVAPVEQGGNANTLMAIVRRWRNAGEQADVIGQAVVVGAPHQVERIRKVKPALRPGLADAIVAAGGDAAAHVLLLPTKDVKRVIEALTPTLPKPVGGGPVTTATNGITWAAAGFDIGPAPSARIVVQSPDARSAGDLLALINDIPKHLRAEIPTDGPLLAQLLEKLAFKQEKDRLTMSLEKDGASAILTALLPALGKARERANRVRSASNMRQLLQGVYLWGNDRKGEWPDDLRALIDTVDIQPVVFTNPRNPEAKPAYIYLKPVNLKEAISETIVLYEDPKTVEEGVNVGFFDGHVEFMLMKAFNESLAAQQKRK